MPDACTLPTAEQPLRLAARETECCSFFTFTISPQPATDGEALTLDINVPAAYTGVLDSLAQRAATVSTSSAS